MEPGPGFYNPDYSFVLKKFPAIKFTQTKEKRSEIIPKEKMYIPLKKKKKKNLFVNINKN